MCDIEQNLGELCVFVNWLFSRGMLNTHWKDFYHLAPHHIAFATLKDEEVFFIECVTACLSLAVFIHISPWPLFFLQCQTLFFPNLNCKWAGKSQRKKTLQVTKKNLRVQRLFWFVWTTLEIKIQLDFCNCGFILLDSKSSRHVVKFCIQFMQQREIHSLYMVNRVILHSDQSPTPTTLEKKK